MHSLFFGVKPHYGSAKFKTRLGDTGAQGSRKEGGQAHPGKSAQQNQRRRYSPIFTAPLFKTDWFNEVQH